MIAIWARTGTGGGGGDRGGAEALVGVQGAAAWLLIPSASSAEVRACWVEGVAGYVRRLSAALALDLAEDPSVPMPHAISHAITSVMDAHRATCPEEWHVPNPTASVAVVRQRGRELDYYGLGEAAILLTAGGVIEEVTQRRVLPGVRQARPSLAGSDPRAAFQGVTGTRRVDATAGVRRFALLSVRAGELGVTPVGDVGPRGSWEEVFESLFGSDSGGGLPEAAGDVHPGRGASDRFSGAFVAGVVG